MKVGIGRTVATALALLVALVALLGTAGSAAPGRPPPSQVAVAPGHLTLAADFRLNIHWDITRPQFDAARAKWLSQAAQDYTMEIAYKGAWWSLARYEL